MSRERGQDAVRIWSALAMRPTPTRFRNAAEFLADEVSGMEGSGTVRAVVSELTRESMFGRLALPWAMAAVRGERPELEPTDWRDIGELLTTVGTRTAEFLRKRELGDLEAWPGRIVGDDCSPVTLKGGVWALDVLLADLLEDLGETDWAGKVRETSPEDRGKRWRLGDGGAGETVCRAVWEMIRRQARTKRPATTRETVTGTLLPVMSRQGVLPTLDDGRVLDRRNQTIGQIALTDARMTLGAVRKGLGLFGTPLGHRLIKSLVLRSHAEVEAGSTHALEVTYQGGWSGLAKELGFQGRDTSTLTAIARAGAAVRWYTPHARGIALWALYEARGNHLGPGEVTFTLGKLLAPRRASELKLEAPKTSREARQLVPELRFEPPLKGLRANEEGAAFTLHRRLLLEMTIRAEDISIHGGVKITPRKWNEMAEEAGLPLRCLEKLLIAWQEGQDETAPQLLEQVSPGVWALARPHALEWEFLRAGGERRIQGAAGIPPKRGRK